MEIKNICVFHSIWKHKASSICKQVDLFTETAMEQWKADMKTGKDVLANLSFLKFSLSKRKSV